MIELLVPRTNHQETELGRHEMVLTEQGNRMNGCRSNYWRGA